jgi:hypothetical protein
MTSSEADTAVYHAHGSASKTGRRRCSVTRQRDYLLDRRGYFPNSGRSMGKHDNRTSMKMRRRKAQKKLKTRIKRQRTEKKVARTGGKAAKKPRAAAPAKE